MLRLENGFIVLDATVGCGGHAEKMLERIWPGGLLIGIDRDEKALRVAGERLARFGKITRLIKANFANLDTVMKNMKVERIDAALFDIGVSSYQIQDPCRGFSFEREGPLDMRMDLSQPLSAYEIVNRSRREKLESIIRDLGQERYWRRITGAILEKRKKRPIRTTRELSETIKEAVGKRYLSQRIHPATRVFQAIRIAVNGELENLDAALSRVTHFMKPGGRLCVISFHSLEDRIVKKHMKELKQGAKARLLTKKPLRAGREEVAQNARARSARLRACEII